MNSSKPPAAAAAWARLVQQAQRPQEIWHAPVQHTVGDGAVRDEVHACMDTAVLPAGELLGGGVRRLDGMPPCGCLSRGGLHAYHGTTRNNI